MDVKFWGTRGSLPRAFGHATFVTVIDQAIEKAKSHGVRDLDEFRKALSEAEYLRPLTFGGNTSCTHVSSGQDHVYIDAGSGLAWAGDFAMKEMRKEFHIFQTHFHWDHIMGLPFFIPIYIAGMRIHIYHVHKTGPEDIRIQFNGRNFPVLWDQLGSTVEFHQLRLYEPVKVGALSVTPFSLDHPGGSFGYRVDGDGGSFAVGVDGEYKRFTPAELGRDLTFYQNLTALAFDGQYEMDELVSRYDWGHCTPTIGVDLALREGIRNLILTHHDPRSPDSKSIRMLEDARKYLSSQIGNHKDTWDKLGQPDGTNLFSAYDGLTLRILQNKCTVV